MAKVSYSAFNLVRNKIASVIGTPKPSPYDLGYNLTVSSSAVDRGYKVYGSDLNLVIQDLNTAYEHQTGSPTLLDLVPRGKLIESSDLTPISTHVDTAYTNRIQAGPGKLSVVNSASLSDGTPWTTIYRYKIRFDWGSNNAFRGWANLGGFISIGASLSGGSGGDQNGAWANLFQAIGNVVIGADSAVLVNNTRSGTFPNGGLYNILQNGQSGVNAGILFTILAADANYTTNRYSILLTPYGGTGATGVTGFYIEHKLQDAHTPRPHTTSDLIDGTLGISHDTYYAYSTSPSVSNSDSGLGTIERT